MSEQSSSEATLGDFRLWLERNTSLRGRSISDVISRVRRAARMINLPSARTAADVQTMSLRSPEFQRCTMPVKSQIKRAACLFVQFRGT